MAVAKLEKWKANVPIIVFIVVLFLYPLIQRKIQAGLWHLCYGNDLIFRGYKIPIPADWVGFGKADEALTMFKVDLAKTDKTPSINFLSSGTSDLNAFSDQYHKFIESNDLNITETRTIDFDSSQALCIGSDSRSYPDAIPDSRVIFVTCETNAGISAQYGGDRENIATLYSVLTDMRRQN